MRDSNIEWTHHTFNPWIGCTKIGPGCNHCYAERHDARFGGGHWGAGAPRRRTSAANWNEPLRWQREAVQSGRRLRVFCASLADVFDAEVDPAWRVDLWDLIRQCTALDWIIVTKRIGNARRMLPADWGGGWSHVWLLATVTNQAEADRDVPKLLDMPAQTRGLSIEPMLGQIDLSEHGLHGGPGQLDWVIAGGESGPDARPMHPQWVSSVRDQCAAAGCAFFFKQWGEWAPRGLNLMANGTDASVVDPRCKRWKQIIRLTESGKNGRYTENYDGGEDRFMQRVGRALAGRRLWDGQMPLSEHCQTHDAFPVGTAEHMT
ncbi:MAG TPA: phage Gp37/Gp68 family protein [Rhodocyclaceae bacterium]|uniref:phage Gp37/Gp68 family protein n=1 Tax=Plasticicumulans sp. TaxID=2307179 RepID=UPI002CD49479|nr:phage Gp37/Gp68 family protein [Rhodocyclaceae bacterium]HNI74763.1 phage Gp37/Gp68 family protein [Accumulibacter sp.]